MSDRDVDLTLGQHRILTWSTTQLAGYVVRQPCSKCQGDHEAKDCFPDMLAYLMAKLRKRKRGAPKVKRQPAPPVPKPVPVTCREWYSELYPLIRWRIKQRLRTAPEYRREDIMSNALAESWVVFQKFFNKVGKPYVYKDEIKETTVEDVARIAANASVRRALMGREFASTRQGGYVDALDPKIKREDVDLGFYPAPIEAVTPPWDTQDMSGLSFLVSRLPDRLRDIAFLIGANDNMCAIVRAAIGPRAKARSGSLQNAEMAAYLKCSLRTVERLIGDLRIYWKERDATKRALREAVAEWIEDYAGS